MTTALQADKAESLRPVFFLASRRRRASSSAPSLGPNFKFPSVLNCTMDPHSAFLARGPRSRSFGAKTLILLMIQSKPQGQLWANTPLVERLDARKSKRRRGISTGLQVCNHLDHRPIRSDCPYPGRPLSYPIQDHPRQADAFIDHGSEPWRRSADIQIAGQANGRNN